MRFRSRALLTILLSLAAVVPAAAQVVVDGGAPNGIAGWNIFDDNRAAATFSLGATTSFDAIRFWGILPDGPVYTPNIYWEILKDAGGLPGTTVAATGNAVTTAVPRTALPGFPAFTSWQFDLDAGQHSLTTGVYWLALHDGPLDASIVSGSTLFWEETDPPGNFVFQTFSIDDDWNPVPDNGLAFQLLDNPISSPEPASLLLCATGLAVVGGAGIRRRVRGRKTVEAKALLSS